MRLSHLPERKKHVIVFYKHSAPRSSRLFRGDRNVVFAPVKVFSGSWHPIRAISDQPAQLPRKSSRERCQNLDSYTSRWYGRSGSLTKLCLQASAWLQTVLL